jgi:HSP20 family protein
MVFLKVRLDPGIGEFHTRVNRWMERMMTMNRPVLSPSGGGWTPEADIFETPSHIHLIANLAGVRKEDIDVTYHNNHLRLSGKRFHSVPKGSAARYHQLEMGHGEFERFFRVPDIIDPNRIEATLEDGLLIVRMAKGTGPRGINIEVTS